MWKEFLSSIGIGSVKVDTVLEKGQFTIGEVIEGKVVITGGKVPISIQSIMLQLVYQLEEVRDDSDFSSHEKEMDRLLMNIDREILPGETQNFPFEITLRKNHPVTEDNKQTFLRTTVIIPQSVDATDQDEIIIKG
ncbi:hypothetical protein CEW92_04285 [Bacillaceae bacterium SAS-127]|nr:hypothetical protein CEW92_04285 [Bacillaceae bacterium SAS-127]